MLLYATIVTKHLHVLYIPIWTLPFKHLWLDIFPSLFLGWKTRRALIFIFYRDSVLCYRQIRRYVLSLSCILLIQKWWRHIFWKFKLPTIKNPVKTHELVSPFMLACFTIQFPWSLFPLLHFPYEHVLCFPRLV